MVSEVYVELSKSDMNVYIRILLSVLGKSEEIIREIEHDGDEHIWIVFITYVVVNYVLSIRSSPAQT